MLAMIYVPVVWLAVLSFRERPLSGMPYPLGFANYEALAR